MNKTKIEYADYTWNPVTGCLHTCSYCYARRIANRFKGTASYPMGFTPTLHVERLGEPAAVKKPSIIFVSSMGDLFGEWVPDEWIRKVFDACKAAPQHAYLFLTKNPKRYKELDCLGAMPKGSGFWYGSTVTGPNAQSWQRIDYNTFISFEPLLGKMGTTKPMKWMADWVILGGLTGPGSESYTPDQDTIKRIEDRCVEIKIPCYFKNNLAVDNGLPHTQHPIAMLKHLGWLVLSA